MKITDFAERVCAIEGGKVNLKIAQVKEVLKATNTLTNGELYKSIRLLEPPVSPVK
jgi:hypothetical protein